MTEAGAPTVQTDQADQRTRPDLLGAACGLVALVVYLAHGFDGVLSKDSAVYIYGGQRFADGVLPYVDLVNRAGPLAHAIPGVGVWVARLVGGDDVLGVRVLFMLLSAACVTAVYHLGRDLFASRAAGLVAAATLLSFEGFTLYATYGPREKTAMVLFLTLALLAVVHRRWLTAGVLVSLSTLVWQPVLFGALTGLVVAVALGVPVRQWWRALARVAVGGTLPALATVLVYAVAGEVRTLLDCFLLINARYTRQGGPLGDPGHAWHTLTSGYGVTIWLLLGGLVGLVVLAVVAGLRGRLRESGRSAALAGAATCAVVSVVWTLQAYDNWPDSMVLVSCAAVGVGGVVSGAVARLAGSAARVLTAVACVACLTLAIVYSVGERKDILDDQRASVTAVQRILPDARVVSVEAPQAMVLGGWRNPSRFQLFGNGLVDYVDDTWPGGIDGYGRWIDLQAPDLIVVSRSILSTWLTPTLERSYDRVGHAPNWVWYARRDLPQVLRHDLTQAIRDA